MIEKLTATIKIFRPVNFLITFISVIVAAIICQPSEIPWLNVALAAFSASFVMASGNIINDIYDIEIDKINQPQRVLAASKISISSVVFLYTLLIVISLLFAWFINLIAFGIVIGTSILLFLYSKSLKKFSLVGNIVVAFLTGLVFIFGGVAVDNPDAAIVPALFAFLINLIREIVKDMEDVDGDAKVGIVTFPIKFGYQKSKYFILLITTSLIVITIYPFITELYKIEYFIVVMVIVNPILVYCSKKIFEDHSIKNLKKISNLLKLNMIFGLIAIYLGV